MDRDTWIPRRDAAIEKRIGSLSVNAADREMAQVHYRRAVTSANRVFDLTSSLRAFARTLRIGPGERKHRIG